MWRTDPSHGQSRRFRWRPRDRDCYTAMKILLIKAELAGRSKEPAEDKMRRIFQSHVDEAKTEEDRRRALKALKEFTRATRAEKPARRPYGQDRNTDPLGRSQAECL